MVRKYICLNKRISFGEIHFKRISKSSKFQETNFGTRILHKLEIKKNNQIETLIIIIIIIWTSNLKF